LVEPHYPILDLDEAITKAVTLRSDEGVVALSGGVDSALVARLAGRECIVVGVPGSHDLLHARLVACELGLKLHEEIIDPKEIEEALRQVLAVIPSRDPVNASIAATLYFISRWAGDNGQERILAGQGADELFGGYSRYLHTSTLAQDMEADLLNLPSQLARDQAVAGLFGAYFSLPYLDLRVVAAARSIPAEMKVRDNVRKRPLREIALRHMPATIAQYEKKAMQYGSGVMKEMERIAARQGFKRSLKQFLREIDRREGRDMK
jgi:asparagine synthase (glutamine-hydrolysing)